MGAHPREFCQRGHSMADAYIDPRGMRSCRPCKQARDRNRLRPHRLRPPIPAGCVDAAPLAEMVRRIIADSSGYQQRRGLKEFARRYAARFGRRQGSVERWLTHLALDDFAYVREERADELCTILGTHLTLVYPGLYGCVA